MNKALLNALKVFGLEVKQALASEISEDQIKISSREVGASVELINPDGSLSPAPDGEYAVSDFKFVVKDGVIASIEGEEPKPEAEVEAEDEKVEETPAEETKPNEEVEQLTAKVADLEAKIASMEALIADMTSKQDQSLASSKKFNQDLKTEVEKMNVILAKVAGMPVETSKVNTSFNAQSAEDKKLANLQAMFAKK